MNETCRKGHLWLSIRRILKYTSLTITSNCSVVNTLVISHLDYCNGILYGLPKQELDKLQRIQNTAARLITGNKQYEHITPALRELHMAAFRLNNVVILITCKILNGLSPSWFVVPVKRLSPTTKSSFILQITFYCPHSELCEMWWRGVFLPCTYIMEYSSRFT